MSIQNVRVIIFLLVFGSSITCDTQQDLSADQIIAASIAYHDPEGLLNNKKWKMSFEDSRPDGSQRKASFEFDPRTYDFQMERNVNDNAIRLGIKEGQFSATLNGKADFSEAEAEEFRINEERATMMRNYYHYLWCMPMKLKDPGTLVQNLIKEVDFFGKTSLEIKVTYEESVGNDIWYFYFNPSTYALQGYRFYHDESANDGEYITLDNEVSMNGVKIPQTRRWYMHQDAKYLGEDNLVSIDFY